MEMMSSAANIELVNLALERGSSLEAGSDTAINHFSKYLALQHSKNPTAHPYTKYSQLTLQNYVYVTSAVISIFGDYLKKVAGIKSCSTCLAYVSRIKNQLIRDFPAIEKIFEGKWYTDLRRKIVQIYVKECQVNGTKLVDKAPPMTENDLKKLNKCMFEMNNRESDLQRALFSWQWQLLGRISEVSALSCTMMSSYNSSGIKNATKVNMSRLKTSTQDDILVFLHANSFELCPLHALATHIITNRVVDRLFPTIPEGSEAQYVNRILNVLSSLIDDEEFTEALRSHSGRSGPATYANEHPDIQTQWIIPRGGWTLDGLQTIFNYLCGTTKTDSKVGRALSGWRSANEGAACPSIDCIPEVERELFRTYTASLLGSCSSLHISVRNCLMCVLLLHWSEVVERYPQHNLVQRMSSVSGVQRSQIDNWAQAVRGWFRTQNAPFLPLGELDDDDRIAYSTIADQFRNTSMSLRLVQEEVGQLRESHLNLLAEVRSFGRQLNNGIRDLTGKKIYYLG